MDQAVTFGRYVRQRRHELDLTQEELARRVGCAAITIRKIEADDARPSVQIAERLAMALAIPLDDRADFVRRARAARAEPAPQPVTPAPAMSEIGSEDLSGRAIRGYALAEKIGAGGMGAVYRATQPLVEREVAVKIILPAFANHPDFIRRFETEAQLVARLEHPHIVPLYDYWREPGVAYLIMRLLRGGSVERLLQQGPLPLETVARMLEQIGAALHAAHRIGVIHRDLKPGNVLLDDDQNAYLADFGIAKNLGNPNLEDRTQMDALVGSPQYMSPEQIKSLNVRPQSDIYCLGVMLYEMLTGALPFAGPTPFDLIQQHVTAPMPPLAARRAGLPAALDDVIGRAAAKDADERYPDVPALLADFRHALQAPLSPAIFIPEEEPLVEVNPYKGLRAFAESDADDFFGRETLIQQLLSRLGEGGELARFLAVVGPSGSGKSSVVKAGLVPALRRGGLLGSEHWFYVDLLPGPHPFEELEAALLRVAVNPPASLLEQLTSDARGLARAVNRILPADESVELVLVIDQFEELFTLTSAESERALLLNSLVAAVLDERSRLRVVLTLRADFIDRPLRYVDFGELMQRRSELVLPLTPDELERAIVGPARRVGLRLEAGLASRMIREVGDQPGALPLLQYTLSELFDQRAGNVLTRAAYDALGGVAAALGRRAEAVYASLNAGEQDLARQLFLRLVTLGEGVEDTRRRVLRSELESVGEAARQASPRLPAPLPPLQPLPFDLNPSPVLTAFGNARLLSFDRDPGTRGPTVEVAHEALLREWPRLREWLAESRADVRQQRQLAQAAGEWEANRQDHSYLLTGTRLAQFEGWIGGASVALTPAERAFYEASIAERDRREQEETARQGRELATAQQLAETERRRADEQTRSVAQVRVRNRLVTVAGVIAFVLALVAGVLAGLSNQNAQQAQANLGLAQSANTQSAANAASADLQRNAALNAQATAQAEAGVRATAEANAGQARAKAEQQAALAFARELGAAAELKLAADPQLSLLLALQAVSVTRAAGLGDPYDVQQTLHDVMPAQRLLWSQEAPTYYFNKVAYSADGQRFIASADGPDGIHTIDVDVHTRQTLRSAPGYGFAISPDETVVATSQLDNVIYLWDAVTSQLLVTMTDRTSAGIVGYGIVGFAFSPDGDYLATGGVYAAARLWDLRAWRAAGRPAGVTLSQPARTLDCYHTNWYGGINFSPDGQRLVMVCGKDNTAKVWDVASGREVISLTGHTGRVSDAAFSPDGQRLATASADGTARLWEASTGRELFRLNTGANTVQNVAFSPNGQTLAISSEGLAIVWDVNTGSRLLDLPNPAVVYGLAFSPDGQRLIVAMSGGIQEWDVSRLGRGELATAPHYFLYDFNNSPDGSLFAGLEVDGRLHVYDSATLEEKWATLASPFPLPGDARTLSFSADNSLLAAGISNTVTIWRADTGQKLMDLAQPGEVWAGALSPDGRRLAASVEAGAIVLWDLADPPISQTLPTGLGCLVSVEFSPDGAYLAAGGSSGGPTAYCGGAQIDVWDLTAGQERTPPPVVIRPTNSTLFPAAVIATSFSPDGQRLAVAGHQGAAILDWAADTWVFTMTAHTANLNYLKYSPDGKYVVTTSNDRTAKIWDAHTGTELLSYPLGSRSVWAFFAPQARGVVIVTGVLRTYRLQAFDPGALITAARARLVRGWTPAECRKYLHVEQCPAP